VIADDHAVVRRGLKLRLGSYAELARYALDHNLIQAEA
jgi:DNA-binding NarL/FixJ family response regulator